MPWPPKKLWSCPHSRTVTEAQGPREVALALTLLLSYGRDMGHGYKGGLCSSQETSTPMPAVLTWAPGDTRIW